MTLVSTAYTIECTTRFLNRCAPFHGAISFFSITDSAVIAHYFRPWIIVSSFIISSMKTINLVFLLSAAFTQSASAALRASKLQQMQDLIENADLSTGQLDVSSLDLYDEREARPFCDLIVGVIQTPLNQYSPFPFTCKCQLKVFQRVVDFGCGTNVCMDDIQAKMGVDVSMSLPLLGDYCVKPSYTGEMKIRAGGNLLTSTVCSGSDDLTLNVTEIEQRVGMELSDRETITFDVPNVCVDGTHPPGVYTVWTSCRAKVDGVNCPCEMCGDRGQDIKLNCPDVFANYIPRFLQNYLGISNRCIGLSMFSGQNPSRNSVPLMAPLFEIRTP